MITGVQDVYYNVSDMGRALAFYRDVLGLAVTDDDPYFTALTAGGMRLGLHWTGGGAVPEIPHDAHGPHAGGTLTFRVADAGAAAKRLREHGVEVLSHTSQSWGTIVVFKDPDGNILKLMQPPG